MSLLLTIFLILIIINLVGGFALPTYRSGNYYAPSWGGIVLLLIILYLCGYR